MNIAVYCGSSAGSKEAYTIGAVALGMWIAENGHTLVYGGARGGLMGTIANSVLSNGGKVIGVLPQVESIQNRRHQFLTEYIDTKDMAERKAKMIELADAYIALPGGPGTLDELSDIISLQRLHINENPCILYDIDGFYQPLKAFFEEMQSSGFAAKEDFNRVLISKDLSEIEAFIQSRRKKILESQGRGQQYKIQTEKKTYRKKLIVNSMWNLL